MTLDKTTKADPWKTAVAIPVAIITYFCVSIAVHAGMYLGQTLLTVWRPGIIDFFSTIMGAVSGIAAAEWICDRTLECYSKKSVFIAFVVLVVFGFAAVIARFINGDEALKQIVPAADLIATGFFAYGTFVKGS